MKILATKIQNIPLEEITPYEGAHHTEETVELLKTSINTYGITQPIILDKGNNIIAGNAVYKAAKELGMKEIPCIVKDDLTPDEVAQYRIADNKTGEFASWNEQKLKKELSCLSNPEDLQFAFDEDLMGMLKQDAPVVPRLTDHSDPEKEKLREEQDETKFKQQLRNTESNMEAKPTEYFEYVCSKCGKTVRVRKTW